MVIRGGGKRMSNIETGIVLKVPKELVKSDRSVSSKLGRRGTTKQRKERRSSRRGGNGRYW